MPQLTGKQIGSIGYGLMGLTWRQTPPSQEQAFSAMREALKQGCNFWNGGELYGSSKRNSLHLLNEYFTKYPEDSEKVVISIKGGCKVDSLQPGGDRENVHRSIHECLKVLDGKKFLDIFECARVDPAVPIEDTIGYIAEFVKAGKLGGISLSEVSAASIRRAAKVHPIVAVEMELSLWSTGILENGVATTCAELGIPIVAYSPLGRGFLTGQIKSSNDLDAINPMLKHFPRFQPDVFDENLKLVQEVQKISEKKGCTNAQVALAWVKAQSSKPGMPTIIAIPGATTAERVAENAKEVTLSDAELNEIASILAKFEVKGERYGKEGMAVVDA